MRIPPSVIVMSVLTAVPFGLGIRDTLADKDAGAEADEYRDGRDFGSLRSARERSRELAEYEAEMRRDAMERETRAKQRLASLDQLYGAKPAAMGTLLDGIVLGAGAGSFQPEHVRSRIERASRDGFINVGFDADASTLNAVNVHVSGDYETSDACETLADKLADAWGWSTNGTWIDPATHQRATLELEPCNLTFDRYVEPADWVAQLPLAAIGGNADAFAEKLGPSAEVQEDRVYWSIPGIRFGKRDSKLVAFVAKGRVVGFSATVATDFDSTVAVREALSAKLRAEPKRDEETGMWTWKRRVPVTLDPLAADRVTVLVGQTPWD